MHKNILVVGSINLDLVARVPRFPAPGETISGLEFKTFPGGKGANQAVALGRLGAPVAMIGRLGQDVFAETLRASLNAANVDTRYVTNVSGSSGTALIASSISAENTIIIVPGANHQLREPDIEALQDIIQSSSMVLAQLEVPLSTVKRLGQIACSAGVPFMLDPAPAAALSRDVLRTVTWLTPNQTEAQILLGLEPQELPASLTPQVANQLLKTGVRNVAIKLGSEGVYLAGADVAPAHISGFSVNAVDTTAAGDAFNGAFAYALMLGGMEPLSAAKFANAAAALSVTKFGAQTSMPELHDVEHFLAERSSVIRARTAV